MNRRHLLANSGLLAMAAIAGCLAPIQEGVKAGSDGFGPTIAEPPGVSESELATLVEGNTTFALDLHRYASEGETSNLFISPYSISVALAMTYAGARGSTREEMGEVLNFTLGEDVHQTFAELYFELESRETTVDEFARDDEDDDEDPEVDAFKLNVANALWGNEGYPFDEDYIHLVERYYGAGFKEANFTGDPDGERIRINDWVAAQTEDRIDELLEEGSITPATELVLTNAIYFMASWLDEFDPTDTEDGEFTNLDGSTATVPLMQQRIRTNYASVDGARAVELPYVGEEVSMVLILPDQGRFETFEQDLDSDHLNHIFDALGDSVGELVLPSFEFETSLSLGEALADLGMPTAFQPGADFSGIATGDEAGLWIDDVYHDAFISLDEEGTEAAAATAVMMVTSAPPDWGELRFDRPFIFCIRDRPTDAILFLGRVCDL